VRDSLLIPVWENGVFVVLRFTADDPVANDYDRLNRHDLMGSLRSTARSKRRRGMGKPHHRRQEHGVQPQSACFIALHGLMARGVRLV